MEEPRKTKLEIIEESVNYMKKYGLAKFDDNCRYKIPGSDHPGCLIGRVMDKRKYQTTMENNQVPGLLLKFNIDSIDDILKKDYQGHDNAFWSDLQNLHDGHGFFDEATKEFTQTGKMLIKHLKRKYSCK